MINYQLCLIGQTITDATNIMHLPLYTTTIDTSIYLNCGYKVYSYSSDRSI